MPIVTEQQQFAETAHKVYEERLKDRLEEQHPGEVIALDPESGDYVLGKTLAEVDRACHERFGGRPVHVFRIGGGGAVQVGGRWRGRTN
jgi:hypothetical protein